MGANGENLVTLNKLLLQGAAGLALWAVSAVPSLAMDVDIYVDKVSQHMRVSVDGVQKYNWLVSTGGQGFDTPSGTFHIFRMEKDHFSKEWDDAPMPYSMFFTGIGHAIHGSYHVKALGTRASHGCVRLAPENAAVLWDLITKAGFKNNTVVIKGGLFDMSPQLTTEQTFHMQPKDHVAMGGSNGGGLFGNRNAGQPKPLFWWLRKPVADNDVAPVKPAAPVKKKIIKKKVVATAAANEG